MKQKSIRKRFWMIGLAVFFGLVLLTTALNAVVCLSTREKIKEIGECGEIPLSPEAVLVLGAGVRPDGSPSLMLRDRLLCAWEIYRSGACKTILVSGDHSGDYDEVAAMKRFLTEKGVPEQNVLCDEEGFSTYASVWRAKNVLGLRKIWIVTQHYHAYRAVYIAGRLGMESYAVSAAIQTEGVERYSRQPWYDVREGIARCKDLIWCLFRPKP